MDDEFDPRVRGRTRGELEADVIAGMIQERAACQFAADVLRVADFAIARHRAMFLALASPAARRWPPCPDSDLARAIGETPRVITAWRLAAAPSTPSSDVSLLVEAR